MEDQRVDAHQAFSAATAATSSSRRARGDLRLGSHGRRDRAASGPLACRRLRSPRAPALRRASARADARAEHSRSRPTRRFAAISSLSTSSNTAGCARANTRSRASSRGIPSASGCALVEVGDHASSRAASMATTSGATRPIAGYARVRALFQCCDHVAPACRRHAGTRNEACTSAVRRAPASAIMRVNRRKVAIGMPIHARAPRSVLRHASLRTPARGGSGSSTWPPPIVTVGE